MLRFFTKRIPYMNILGRIILGVKIWLRKYRLPILVKNLNASLVGDCAIDVDGPPLHW